MKPPINAPAIHAPTAPPSSAPTTANSAMTTINAKPASAAVPTARAARDGRTRRGERRAATAIRSRSSSHRSTMLRRREATACPTRDHRPSNPNSPAAELDETDGVDVLATVAARLGVVEPGGAVVVAVAVVVVVAVVVAVVVVVVVVGRCDVAFLG